MKFSTVNKIARHLDSTFNLNVGWTVNEAAKRISAIADECKTKKEVAAWLWDEWSDEIDSKTYEITYSEFKAAAA